MRQSTETHFTYSDTYCLKVNEWRKIYDANTNPKKAEMAILISDRAEFNARKAIRINKDITY